MPSTTRYTAKVMITKVTHTEEQYKQPQRDVGEVADFTVRGEDLDRLKANIQSHVDLVEDE